MFINYLFYLLATVAIQLLRTFVNIFIRGVIRLDKSMSVLLWVSMFYLYIHYYILTYVITLKRFESTSTELLPTLHIGLA